MSSNAKRILISFVVTVVGLFSTSYYFTKYYPAMKFHIDEKPIAKVEKLESTSRKKLAQHRTWQIVEFGDSLYSGETIKTSHDADLSVRFLDSNTILNLEADSLITITNNKGEISLNLIEGYLFVDSSKNETASSLKLESKDGLIDLSKATVSLSKDKNSELSLNVVSGEVTLKNASGKVASILAKKSKIVITEPIALSILEVKKPEVKMQWLAKPLEANETVQFKLGTKRSDLTLITPLKLEKNEATLPVRFGKNFIQMEITNSLTGEKQQATVRFELNPIIEPVAAQPVVVPQPSIEWANNNEEVQQFTDKPELDLKWSLKNKGSTEKVNVKVFADEKLVFTQSVSANFSTLKVKLAGSGRYMASVEAVDLKAKSLSQSKMKSIVAQELPFLPAAEWTDSSDVADAELDGTYNLKWKPLEEVNTYKLELVNPTGKVVKTWDQKNTFVQLNNLLPGDYKVTLATLDKYNRLSPSKATKIVKVADSSAIDAPKLKKMRFK